jgi:hypothetical protein
MPKIVDTPLITRAFRIEPADDARLQEAARKRGTTASGLARILILRELDRLSIAQQKSA